MGRGPLRRGVPGRPSGEGGGRIGRAMDAYLRHLAGVCRGRLRPPRRARAVGRGGGGRRVPRPTQS
eukprot:9322171-Lingulodinium_polyedra.AAC.1